MRSLTTILLVIILLGPGCIQNIPFQSANVEPQDDDHASSAGTIAQSRALNWTILPETSASAPTIHDFLELRVNEPVAGAKYYKIERVSDMGGSSVVADSYYPVWFNGTVKVFSLTSSYGQKSSVSGPHYLRLSAWSQKPWFGGTQIGTFSNVIPVHYDHSYENLDLDIQVTVTGPGQATLRAVPQNATLGTQSTLYTWSEYVQATDTSGNLSYDTNGKPIFARTGLVDQQFVPEFKASLTRSGVRYFGLLGAWNGIYGWTSSPLIECGVKSHSAPLVGSLFQPLAIVVPHENGTTDPFAINFTGPSVTTPSIPGDLRFGILKDHITVFSGGTLYPQLNGIQPAFVELELPYGMHLVNGTAPYKVQNVSSLVMDGSLSQGYDRFRLNKTGFGPSWSYLNSIIPMHFEYDEALFNGRSVDIRLRLYNDQSNFTRTDDWQTLTVACEAIPSITLPKRLSTGITWSSMDWLVNTSVTDPKDAFLGLYKRLGFNTVPQTGTHYISPASMDASTYSPDERTGASWDGMMYGPEHSTFYRGYFDGMGIFNVLTKDPSYMAGYNLTNFGVDLANLSMEEQKWSNALAFYTDPGMTTHFMDLAYDGIFLKRDIEALNIFLNETKPEYIFIDSEGFGSSFASWAKYVNRSANANARRLPGETDDELAYRISDEFIHFWIENVTRVSSGIKVAFYGASANHNYGYGPFPWDVMARYRIVAQPSYYTYARDMTAFTNLLRNETLWAGEAGEVIPWLSSGTYGEFPSATTFDMTAHNLLSGAVGFSFYTTYDIDDMADILNMAKVVGHLAPYEDIIMDGTAAHGNITGLQNAVVSAMSQNGTYLIAVTQLNAAIPFAFKVEPNATPDPARGYRLTDLVNGTSQNFTDTIIDVNGSLDHCAIYLLEPYTIVFPNAPPELYNATPKAGSMNVSLKPVLSVSVSDNDTDAMNLTWYTNATGPWMPIGTNISVHNGTYNRTAPSMDRYNTTYWWAVNVTDGKDQVNATFNLTTVASKVPVMANESPSHGSVNVSINLTTVTIDISDPEGDPLDWSIETLPRVGQNSSKAAQGGTVLATISGLAYNTTYTWFVNVTDPTGSGTWTREVYNFTTEPAPPPPPPPPPVPNEPPLANANGPYTGYAGEPVNLDANGSIDPEGGDIELEWSFGDGNSSYGLFPVHTYAEPGNYSIRLMVTDDHGLSANATTYAVIAKRNRAPGTPTISGPAEGIAGAAYNFTLASKDPDGDDIIFIIDWGDGNTTRTVPTPSENATIVNHTWSVPGFFNITVKAVDGSNATSEPARHMIQVAPTPAPVPGDDRKDGGQMALYLALAAMIILIVSALALYMYWRKRKDKGKEAPDDVK